MPSLVVANAIDEASGCVTFLFLQNPSPTFHLPPSAFLSYITPLRIVELIQYYSKRCPSELFSSPGTFAQQPRAGSCPSPSFSAFPTAFCLCRPLYPLPRLSDVNANNSAEEPATLAPSRRWPCSTPTTTSSLSTTCTTRLRTSSTASRSCLASALTSTMSTSATRRPSMPSSTSTPRLTA